MFNFHLNVILSVQCFLYNTVHVGHILCPCIVNKFASVLSFLIHDCCLGKNFIWLQARAQFLKAD